MKKTTMIFAGIFGFIIVAALWFISTGNSLVRKDESVRGAWSQVENVYQRRMDLIPNLVNTVKGYAKHEQETLKEVIAARNQAIAPTPSTADDSGNLKKFQQSQDALSGALSRLMVVVERYPDLKANENFRELQSQLEGTENRIAVERRRFNEVVQDYNTSIRMFPSSFVANSKGLKEKAYFEATKGAETAPKVEF